MVDEYERRHRHQSGLGHSAPYQVSGHPFITGSATVADDTQIKVEFPAVAKSVTVINRANAELYIYFNDATAHVSADAVDSGHTENVLAGHHYISLDNKKDSVTFDIKCKEIYIGNKSGTEGAFQLFAELTSIHPNNMYALSGSGLTDVDGAHGAGAVNNLNQSTI